MFGTMVGQLALQFTAILALEATPLQVSALALCQLIPGFVVGLFAGVWADRGDRRRMMIVADAGRGIVLATIPLAWTLDALTIEQLYLVGLLVSAMTVSFDVAYQAYLPEIVERDQLIDANSKLTASASVAEMGAFSIAGWLVQLLTAPIAILVDAASFVGSALLLGRIRKAGRAAPEERPAEERGMLREARAGLRETWRQPVVRSLAVANLMLAFTSRMVGVSILLYLTREADYNPGVLGVIFAIGGAGSVAGAIIAGRSRAGFGPSITVALLLVSLGTAFVPMVSEVSILGVALLAGSQVVTDPAWTFFNVNELTTRQGLVPIDMQGRVSASVRVLEFGGELAGTVVGGLIASEIGLRETLVVAVCLMALNAVVFAASPGGIRNRRGLKVASAGV